MTEIETVFRLYLSLFDRQVVALLLTLPRTYAFLAASQLLTASAVPRLARGAAILSLSAIAIPINLAYVDGFDRSLASYALVFAKEYAIGFVLGYIVGWIFWAVQSAGALIDNQRGAAIAASIDPLQGHETSPLGILFGQAFLTYVFATGAVLPILDLLYRSYVLWPATLGMPILSEAFPALVLSIADHAMKLVVVIGGPIVAIMFLAEFALAMISRFSPQVQVFILAMPIKSALAIFILIFYFSQLLPFSAQQLSAFQPFAQRFLQVMKFSATLPVPVPPPPAAGP